MAKPEKKLSPLEQSVMGFMSVSGLVNSIRENPENPGYVRQLGEILQGDKNYYAHVPARKVVNGADQLESKAIKSFKENTKYEDLVKQYDQQTLAFLLRELPVLEGKGRYEEIAKAHKRLVEVWDGYRAGVKGAKSDEKAYVDQVVASTDDEFDQFHAAGNAFTAQQVSYKAVQMAQGALLDAIYKIKPEQKKPGKSEN